MDYVRLGGANLKVSPFCLGTMMFGGRTGPEESEQIIRRAYNGGVNFLDTADFYTSGACEEIVGRAIVPFRDKVVLASKVGMKVSSAPNDVGVSRYHIVRSVEASLRRLNTDRLDILYIHWPNDKMNLQEMLSALDDLVRSGKVLYVGCSNFPAWLLIRCLWIQDRRGYDPFVVGQYPYNIIERGIEVEVLPAAAAFKVGITVYRPLAVGLLTGKYINSTPPATRGEDDKRIARWMADYREGITRLMEFAAQRGYTTGEAATAWTVSHPAVTAAIVGISRLDQVETNLRGFNWKMTLQERAEISSFFDTEVWEEAGGKFPSWRRSLDIL